MVYTIPEILSVFECTRFDRNKKRIGMGFSDHSLDDNTVFRQIGNYVVSTSTSQADIEVMHEDFFAELNQEVGAFSIIGPARADFNNTQTTVIRHKDRPENEFYKLYASRAIFSWFEDPQHDGLDGNRRGGPATLFFSKFTYIPRPQNGEPILSWSHVYTLDHRAGKTYHFDQYIPHIDPFGDKFFLDSQTELEYLANRS